MFTVGKLGLETKSNFFSCLFILFLCERERAQAWEGQRERERGNPKQGPCHQHRAGGGGGGAQSPEPGDHNPRQKQEPVAQLTEPPGCPKSNF